jgi:DNA polymerase-3 subunit alpha
MVHLHLHTDFSTLDGASKSTNYVKLAKEFNHPAITILDHGNASGWLTHFQKCKSAGIKPILGMEAYLNDNLDKNISKEEAESVDNSAKNTHQSIIIKNQEGYVNLNKLIYRSFTEGYYYKGRITTEWLIENKKGLIVTSSCMASKFARLIQEGKEKEAEERILLFKREFGDDFYAELQFNEIEEQKIYNKFILKMIKKHDLQPILTGDVHYAKPEDNRLQDILIAINQSQPVGKAFSLQARELYYTNFENFHEMNKRLGFNYPEHYVDFCLDNTLKVAEKCNFEFEMTDDKYPKYEATPDVVKYFKTENTTEIIQKLSKAKLKQKLKDYEQTGVVQITPEKEKTYYDRLDYELKVIEDKKVLDYFLVVWELIRFCKDNDIATGPGRGSAAGSLLSWCLDITKIDPVRFDLYFERFLNPERKSMPDIDTDFEAGTDEKTLNFLYEKYGKERVVPVITFGTFNEKGCLKDVARALGHDTGFESDVFAVTKEMPNKWDCSLEEWLIHWPSNQLCSDRVRKWILDPNNKEIIDNTIKLQGQLRNLGKHAAGIVITPGPIWESMPVNICKGQIVSGFQESGNAKDLSSIGILKLDRLKLETLNVIKDCIKYIAERHGEETSKRVQLEIDYIDIENKNLYDEIRLGFNQGIFQFESEGMNAMLKAMKCENFDELVAANALYRPGPMGIKAHEEFIKNKFEPEKRQYAHSILEPLLQKTNGVLIYQEQLMFIANQIGGMTLGEGDNLRKAMDGAGKIISKKLEGKELTEEEENNKNYKSYKELWKKFIDGAKAKGLSETDVEKIESWLIKYLGYSFNLSHSLSYSYIALQTLYLKHYYPTEFYCALLNHPKTGNDDEKNRAWLNSALLSSMSKGIKIVPPNRKSNWDWTIIEDRVIAMGYSSINGMGEIAFKELKNKKIELMDKEMFFSTKWSKFNKTNFESCLKAGLFDDWSTSREELIETKQIKYKQSNQLDLFTNEVDTVLTVAERKFKDKDFEKTTDQIRYDQFLEVCSLDLNLLNKIASVKEQFMKATGLNIDSALNFEDAQKFYYFMINNIEKKIAPWDGSNYYVITISDGSATKKVTMNNDLYEKIRLILETNCFYVTKFFKNNKGFLNFNTSAPFRKVIV